MTLENGAGDKCAGVQEVEIGTTPRGIDKYGQDLQQWDDASKSNG